MTFDQHADAIAHSQKLVSSIAKDEAKNNTAVLRGSRADLLNSDLHPAWPSILWRDIKANPGGRADTEGLRNRWAEPDLFRNQKLKARFVAAHNTAGEKLQPAQLDTLESWFDHVVAQPPDLALMPAGAFIIQFRFTLRAPYMSKDDVELHILDNPVRREHVFGFPCVAGSSWKGALRSALRNTWGWKEADERGPASCELEALCGTPGAGQKHPGHEGRFRCYPTYFKKTAIEVINPHNRETKAGGDLIRFECVPAGEIGTFALLYVPRPWATDEEVQADFRYLTHALHLLFTLQGFGAKTSSGFGRANDEVTGAVLSGAGHGDFTRLSELKGVTLQ